MSTKIKSNANTNTNTNTKTKITRPGTKTTSIHLRLTQDEHDFLMKIAQDRNTTLSEYARKMLMLKS